MNKIVYYISIFLFLFIFSSHAEDQKREIRLRVLDEQGTPLFGVYVSDDVTHVLYTTTDEEGKCEFNVAPDATIVFSAIGFENRKFLAKDLPSEGEIQLSDKMIYLETVNVQGMSDREILKKTASGLVCHKRDNDFKYYGNGQYEKITECHGHAVEYRREYGCYFSRGITKRLNMLDLDGEDKFVPAYVKRSYNLSADGYDTLKPLRVCTAKDSRANYDAGNEKIFILMRAVVLYGPLFSKQEYYDFKQLQDSIDYVFSFQTKLSAYPNKAVIFGKGILRINPENFQIKSITFNDLVYNFYRLYRYRSQKLRSSFLSQAELTFAYDSQNVCHVKSCILTTTWKHVNGNGYHSGEGPSRRNPERNRLIEKEAFWTQTFRQIPDEYRQKKRMEHVYIYAGEKRKGEYKPEVWLHLPELLDSRQALENLNRFMNLETQFQHMNNRAYYPEINYQEGMPVNYPYLEAYRSTVLKVFFEDVK